MHVIFSVIDEPLVDDIVCEDLDAIPRVGETASFDTTVPEYRHDRFVVQRVHNFPRGGPQYADPYVFLELSELG